MLPKFLVLLGLLAICHQVAGGVPWGAILGNKRVGDPCPSGFSYYFSHGKPTNVLRKPYEASCYKFSTDQRTWMDSRRQCKALGGDLVSIETAGEQHHLETVIRGNPSLQRPAFPMWTDWGYWTSGTDAAQEGAWKWATTGRSLGYKNWNPGQPNNSNTGGAPQNCMQLIRRLGWKWNDHICNTDMISYICEKKALSIGK